MLPELNGEDMKEKQKGQYNFFWKNKRRLFFLITGGLWMWLAGDLTRQGYAAEKTWLKGYQKTIAGETIGYHSPYPDATSALLVRATDGTMSIEWETEPVPADFKDPFATFIWMAGLATEKGAHKFFLTVNGEPLFTFNTAKDSSEKSWEFPGREEASLSFEATMVDQFQELFGFMFLKLPRSLLKPGQPVRIKVVGEDGKSRDWFMVFQYDLESKISAVGEQALVRKEGKLFQQVRVDISHIAPPSEAVISTDSGEEIRTRLKTGYNAVNLPVEAVAKEKELGVSVKIDGRPADKIVVRLKPVQKRELYLLPHSHVDIGYSDLQVVVEKNHWKYLEQAIDLAQKTADYPPGARFKWNVEVLWAAETYLRQASPDKQEAFIDAAKKGWIGLHGLLANELTGLCHPEELFHLTEFARRLSRRYDLTINSAMITDIPSYTWSLIPALAQSGIRYFSSGPNYMPNLPDGGDRIGRALKTWGDRPFYWVSPSGAEKVLFWMAGRGYSWFHGLNMGNLSFEKKQPIFDYLRELEESGYPYAMVQVRYTVGGDNGPPDPNLSDLVKKWNEEYESPKFVIATSQEMFEEFERRYAEKIPSVRGDFTPYWEDGAASTAMETAMNRNSAARLVQAEALWAMIDPEHFPAEEFYEAWRQAILFDEHTWGAADSVSNPDGENAKTQWAYKRAFALEAEKRSLALRDAALKKPGPAASKKSTRQAIDIFNTSSWPRTDVVLIPKGLSSSGDLVKDESGNPVPCQRLSSGELAMFVSHVPAFGARRYTVEKGKPTQKGSARAGSSRLENNQLSVSVDPKTGALSSFKWKTDKDIEFVDTSKGVGLNEYIYVSGKNPEKAQGAGRVKVSIREPGPLVASLLVESDAPGCRSLKSELRIYDGSDYLEIINLMDKIQVREKESVHFAFPFCIPGGTVHLDLGWAIIRPESDQIPGSCKDYFCVQNSVDISNQVYGLSWVSLDAPLIEIGKITDEAAVEKGVRAWRTTIEPSQTVYSYAMNNYWHTNYKASQEGVVGLRYALRPHKGFETAAIKKFGLERSQPLVAAAAEESTPLGPSLLEVEPAGVIVTSLLPSSDKKGWIVRLWNASGRPENVTLRGAICREGSVYLSNPSEDRLEKASGSIVMLPFGIVTLRIEK
jgi:alpha-mannosidase